MPQNQPIKIPLKDVESPWTLGTILLLEESKRSLMERNIPRKTTSLIIETPLILILQERKEQVLALSLNRMILSPVLKIKIQLFQILIKILEQFKKGNIKEKNKFLLAWIKRQILSLEEIESRLGGKGQSTPSLAPRIRYYSKKNWGIRWGIKPQDNPKQTGIREFILSDGLITKELTEKEFDLLIKEQIKRFEI